MHKPLLVDLTVEEGQRLKVIYGSYSGFHAVDVDSGAVYDIYLPTHVSRAHGRHARGEGPCSVEVVDQSGLNAFT